MLGQKVKLDGRAYTVVGMMPAGFRFPVSKVNAVYTPLHIDKLQRESRGSHWMRTVARLNPGVSLHQAQADLAGVFADLGREHPHTKGRSVKLVGIGPFILGKTDSSLRLLSCAVAALLLLGCVNVAGLLLARGVKREREMAPRAAIGANRARSCGRF